MRQATILIVDDSHEDCATFRRYLTRGGEAYRVTTAYTGGDALQRLKAGETPDCILLDYQLPDMDGLKVLTAFMEQTGKAACPVVMLTVASSPAVAVQAIKGGAEDYLLKEDVTPETLRFAIANAIEKKTMQRELQESRAQFEAAFTNAGVGMALVGLDGRWQRVNAALTALLGYSEAEMLATDFASITHPDDVPENTAMRQAMLAGGPRVRQVEKRYIHENGQIVWALTTVSLVRSPEGEPRYFVTQVQDITQRKQAESALRMSEERLTLAMEGGRIGAFDWNIKTGDVQWSREIEGFMGMSPGEFDCSLEGFLKLVHPDDHVHVQQRIDQALSAGGEYECEFRMVKKDGEIRWVVAKGRVFLDDRGQPARLVGVDIEITERKRREQHLSFLTDLQKELARNLSSQEIMQIAGARIVAYFGLSHCLFVEIDDEQEEAAVLYDCHAPEMQDLVGNYRLAEFHTDQERQQLAAGSVICIHDVRDAPRATAAAVHFEALGIRALMDAPCVTDGRWKFTVSAQCGQPRQWRVDESELLRELAAQVLLHLERARAEERLRASEQRLRFALEASSAGAWDWDVRTGAIVWSPENYRLYDIDPTGAPPRYADWEARVHPEDRAAANQGVRDVLESQSPEYRAEFRIVDRSGGVRWLLGLGRVERDADGAVVRMSGINLDITERKRQQEEIEALNARLHRAVFEGSHRIKNHLQVLAALVDMQLSERDETIPAEEFRRLGGHIKALSAIHDVMTLTTKENAENNILPMKPLLERVLPMFQRSAGMHRIAFTVEEIRLPAKHASSLVLVLNELVSNAIKHGQGEVVVAFRADAFACVLEVCDDGVGFPLNFDARKAANTGLELVGAIARTDLSGQVVYDNRAEGGGRVTISFPVPAIVLEETPAYAVVEVNHGPRAASGESTVSGKPQKQYRR